MERNPWTRRLTPVVLAAALLAAASFLVLTRGSKHDSAPATTPGMPDMAEHRGDVEEGVVHIEPHRAGSLGITVAVAEAARLERTLRTTGFVTYDETRLFTVSTKIPGFVDRLFANFTGRRVAAGEPLLEVYSPDLVAAQEELLAALRLERQLAASPAPGVADRTAGLVESARRRLLLWDISRAQVDEIERSGEVRRALVLHSPADGFVIELPVRAGEAVRAGDVLFRLADLSRVWIAMDVYESDLRFVQPGDEVHADLAAYPGETFAGRVAYIDPDVRQDTRTTRVRAELPNPRGRLKPGMYATVRLASPLDDVAVVVPRDAVMRTGVRDIVFVEAEPGEYRIREVRVGAEVGGRMQILEGLTAGDRVVARANFIIDADTRLMDTMHGQPIMPGRDMGEMPEMVMPDADMPGRPGGEAGDVPGTGKPARPRADTGAASGAPVPHPGGHGS